MRNRVMGMTIAVRRDEVFGDVVLMVSLNCTKSGSLTNIHIIKREELLLFYMLLPKGTKYFAIQKLLAL
ncbi:MAG: hypothetical protein SCARUB_04906 [Candidatus Scalindua rubra]|uniref:Uncharacterized protein n=1 Tax=Candidatus Scalindua rubra TaxID=1872076 RepID=A0A1E3X362_9BACT|nr:MAG: hypothetical protein SCARUB_04906 [Candidatus Scalindua rubra]